MKIEFDNELYIRKAIEQGIIDYNDITPIQLWEDNNKYICEIEHTGDEAELIGLEFSNYVLNMTLGMAGNEL